MSTSTAKAATAPLPDKNPIEAAREAEVAILDGENAARRVTVLETIKKLLDGPISVDRQKTLLALRLKRSRIVRSDYPTDAAYNKALKAESVLDTPLGGLSYKSPGKPKASISDRDKHLAWAEENVPASVEEYLEIAPERIHEAIALLAEEKPELIVTRKRVTEDGEKVLLESAVRADADTVKVPVGDGPALIAVDFIAFSNPTAENTTWSASKSKSAGEDTVNAWLDGNREGIITAIAGALNPTEGAAINA